VGSIRRLYDHQEFKFAGPYGDNGFLEDYTAQVRGEPIGCVALVTRNAAGQTRHIAANYRPRNSLLLMSRLLGEKFAGTPYADYFFTHWSDALVVTYLDATGGHFGKPRLIEDQSAAATGEEHE
jgi:hypothetical protein